jgi:hypothetical protein
MCDLYLLTLCNGETIYLGGTASTFSSADVSG